MKGGKRGCQFPAGLKRGKKIEEGPNSPSISGSGKGESVRADNFSTRKKKERGEKRTKALLIRFLQGDREGQGGDQSPPHLLGHLMGEEGRVKMGRIKYARPL